MNWDQIETNWKIHKESVREHWSELTDEDLNAIAGKREPLLKRLQKRYNLSRAEAESQLFEFLHGAFPAANDQSQTKRAG